MCSDDDIVVYPKISQISPYEFLTCEKSAQIFFLLSECFAKIIWGFQLEQRILPETKKKKKNAPVEQEQNNCYYTLQSQ